MQWQWMCYSFSNIVSYLSNLNAWIWIFWFWTYICATHRCTCPHCGLSRPMTEWRLAAEKEAAPGADTEQWSCHQSRDTTTGHQTAAAPSAVLQCAACQSHHQPHHANYSGQTCPRPAYSQSPLWTVHAGTVLYLNVIFCFGKTRKWRWQNWCRTAPQSGSRLLRHRCLDCTLEACCCCTLSRASGARLKCWFAYLLQEHKPGRNSFLQPS